ncbi:MAG: hypothetical protein V2I67_00395 [Thermoanaerobaculales bacterium]|jgi:hypothetical protein|nr:hypothetical protein [Thermoanaerobaculales bacterium]
MSWLRRSEAPHRPAGGQTPPPRGDPPSVVHDAPALASALEAFDADHPVRLLDLGPALPANLGFYDCFTTGVRIAHLLRDLPPVDPEKPDDASFVSILDRIEPSDHTRFGLILAWNTLDYLTAERAALLSHHLAAVADHGALIHAMTFTAGTIPASPSGYEIVEPGRLIYRHADQPAITAPDIPPADAERRLGPFRVTRSILLRHGVREFVGILG